MKKIVRDASFRRHHDERIISKRKKQNRELGGHSKHDHYLSKTNGLTCGSSKCAMCGNPRKFFNESTIQEKKAELD